MALDTGNTDKLAVFRQECQRQNIKVLPPDINRSWASFSVETTENQANGAPVNPSGPTAPLAIRYALGAIRNVGAEAMDRLTKIRTEGGPFLSLQDFLKRLPREVINRRQMESLARAGAFDSIHQNRRQLIDNMDLLLSYADAMRRESESNQDNLFGAGGDEVSDLIRLVETADWAGMDRLKEEFDVLGLYLSAHPLDSYASQLGRLRVTRYADLAEKIAQGQVPQRINLAGSVTAKQVRVSQRGNRFAFVQLTDQTGVFEITFFSDVLAAASALLDSEKPFFISANVKLEDNGLRRLAARVEL
ncbi:MAG: OB-fold nucleic acid binding domain-containing protein, partial [Candidatus Puniceispirillum sp.]